MLLLAVLALRSIRMPSPEARAPVAGSETGTLDTYLARIEALAAEGADRFYVAATELEGERFLQVSASRQAGHGLVYQFDLPIADWSRGYAARIEAEANHRGLTPFRQTEDGLSFLDIDFPTSGDHAVFARWVAGDVFRLDGDARLRITWG